MSTGGGLRLLSISFSRDSLYRLERDVFGVRFELSAFAKYDSPVAFVWLVEEV